MTPAERARRVLHVCVPLRDKMNNYDSLLRDEIANEVADALAEEREACAKLVAIGLPKRRVATDGVEATSGFYIGGGDEHGFTWSVQDIAAAIRART